MYIYLYQTELELTAEAPDENGCPGESWPLHDIAIANIVWCTAYARGDRGGSYIAQ